MIVKPAAYQPILVRSLELTTAVRQFPKHVALSPYKNRDDSLVNRHPSASWPAYAWGRTPYPTPHKSNPLKLVIDNCSTFETCRHRKLTTNSFSLAQITVHRHISPHTSHQNVPHTKHNAVIPSAKHTNTTEPVITNTETHIQTKSSAFRYPVEILSFCKSFTWCFILT